MIEFDAFKESICLTIISTTASSIFSHKGSLMEERATRSYNPVFFHPGKITPKSQGGYLRVYIMKCPAAKTGRTGTVRYKFGTWFQSRVTIPPFQNLNYFYSYLFTPHFFTSSCAIMNVQNNKHTDRLAANTASYFALIPVNVSFWYENWYSVLHVKNKQVNKYFGHA